MQVFLCTHFIFVLQMRRLFKCGVTLPYQSALQPSLLRKNSRRYGARLRYRLLFPEDARSRNRYRYHQLRQEAKGEMVIPIDLITRLWEFDNFRDPILKFVGFNDTANIEILWYTALWLLLCNEVGKRSKKICSRLVFYWLLHI